jgi:hypothetical protein
MCALSEAIESRELAIQCRCCGWSEPRTLSWLSARRDMNCPGCCSVIVLNTSERLREISHLRRQMAALHEHFAVVIPAVGHITIGARVRVRTTPLASELALAGAYRENLSGRGCEIRSARRR